MTDEQIIKALECCTTPHTEVKCHCCKAASVNGRCTLDPREILDLIHRQQAEIEKLKEVKHGHWIPQYVSSRGLTNIFSCSVCNESSYTNRKVSCHYKYCRNCGAKMEMFGNPEQAKGEENAEVKPC